MNVSPSYNLCRALWNELMVEKKIKIEENVLNESAMWLFQEEDPVHDFETHWYHHSGAGRAQPGSL